jgi:hypothetical protein
VPRKHSRVNCSGCGNPRPGYDWLPERRYDFIPFWGFKVFLVYAKRPVQCDECGAVAETVPWARGKHQLCDAYMLYLADWARKMSWKEVSQRFRTSWEKVFNSVEYVVNWGLEHRDMNGITAIGVDEVQWHKGHKYLTLEYSGLPTEGRISTPMGLFFPAWAGKFIDQWTTKVIRSKIEPMKREAKTVRRHKDLILTGLSLKRLFRLV